MTRWLPCLFRMMNPHSSPEHRSLRPDHAGAQPDHHRPGQHHLAHPRQGARSALRLIGRAHAGRRSMLPMNIT